MEQLMINPVAAGLIGGMPAIGREASVVREIGSGGFQQFLEQRLNQAREASNTFGAGGGNAPELPLPPEVVEKIAAIESRGGDETSLLAAWLMQLMNRLQELSAEMPANGAGASWTMPASAMPKLEAMAETAGMDGADFAMLSRQMSEQGGKIDLTDFFGILSRHFDQLTQPARVTVPETDLPFFQSVLSQLGVPPTEMNTVTEAAVTGDGQLDLGRLLEGVRALSPVESVPSITLSDWEVEQLDSILADAGIMGGVRQAILNDGEIFPSGRAEQGFTLTLPKLAAILRQGVTAVEEQRVAADLPEFAASLDSLLQEAGVTSEARQWTPLLAKSINDIHRELREIVDLASVRVEKYAPAVTRLETMPPLHADEIPAKIFQPDAVLMKDSAVAAGETQAAWNVNDQPLDLDRPEAETGSMPQRHAVSPGQVKAEVPLAVAQPVEPLRPLAHAVGFATPQAEAEAAGVPLPEAQPVAQPQLAVKEPGAPQPETMLEGETLRPVAQASGSMQPEMETATDRQPGMKTMAAPPPEIDTASFGQQPEMQGVPLDQPQPEVKTASLGRQPEVEMALKSRQQPEAKTIAAPQPEINTASLDQQPEMQRVPLNQLQPEVETAVKSQQQPEAKTMAAPLPETRAASLGRQPETQTVPLNQPQPEAKTMAAPQPVAQAASRDQQPEAMAASLGQRPSETMTHDAAPQPEVAAVVSEAALPETRVAAPKPLAEKPAVLRKVDNTGKTAESATGGEDDLAASFLAGEEAAAAVVKDEPGVVEGAVIPDDAGLIRPAELAESRPGEPQFVGPQKQAAPASAPVEQVAPEMVEQQEAVDYFRPGAPGRQQQEIIDQLSRGVMRGLQNRDHHLIMRLNPPELGEVKINLLVRDEQVSVSFAMENGRVKEALESSMQQFKDNLAERGFKLEQFSVNVGQQEERKDAWQQMARNFGQQGARETRRDMPESITYPQPYPTAKAGKGISLFV